MIRALAEVEASLGISSRPRKFIRLGYWMVESTFFRSLWKGWVNGDSETFIPHFGLRPKRRTLSKLWRDWVMGGGFTSDLAADVICIRNNVRAFYPKFTLKFLMSRSRDLENMRNDVAARERILRHGTVRIPRILNHDLERSVPFTTEELVNGRRLHPRHDVDALVKVITGPIWETYTKEGFHFAPVQEVIDFSGLQELLALCCKALGRAPEPLTGRIMEIVEGEGQMICSFGHGDLSFSNIVLADDGAPWILDWECARELPLACDLARVVVELPEGRKAVEIQLDAITGENLLSGKQQFLMAAVERLLQWARVQKDLEAAKVDAPKIEPFLNLAEQLS